MRPSTEEEEGASSVPAHAKGEPLLGASSMTASPAFRRRTEDDVADPASVLHSSALVDLIALEFVPDKPRARGGIVATFRDARGTLVMIRLSHSAASRFFRALGSGPVAQITDTKGRPLHELIEFQPTTPIEVTPLQDPAESSAG